MRKRISIGVICIGLLLAIGLSTERQPDAFSIVEPVFAESVEASFLVQEAGISAYTNVGQVDLTRVKSVFRTVEKETDDYIIGSVPIPELDTAYDVHVYVQKDGWIVAYYTRDDPASKILGKKYYASTGNKNNLKDAIDIVSSAFGAASGDVKYYDFRYPAGNKMIKIIGEEFGFKVPGDFTVYEASFATGCPHGPYDNNNLRLNDASLEKSYIQHEYGKIGVSAITFDEFNKVYCGMNSRVKGVSSSIILIYRES